MGKTFTEIRRYFTVHSFFFHYNENLKVPSNYYNIEALWTYQGSRVDLHASIGKKNFSKSSTFLAEKNAELLQQLQKNEKSSSPINP